MERYHATKSLTRAYAIQYVTGRRFYKFNNLDGETIYSFQTDEIFNKKIEMLDDIKFLNEYDL